MPWNEGPRQRLVVLAGLAALAASSAGCPKPPPPPDPARSEIAVDRPTGALADGADQVQIRVTVRDSTGAPLAGVAVQLAATGSGNTLLQPAAPTDADGVATGALSTTVAESKTVSATLPQGPLPSQPVVVFTVSLVTGTRAIHYVTDNGVVDRPVDLSGAIVGAYVPGDGGYAYYAGTGTDAGTFRIPGVPAGSYLLKLDAEYVATSSRVIDLSSARQGRPDTVLADAGTLLHVKVTGMAPWTPDWTGTYYFYGSLFLTAPNANLTISQLENFSKDGGSPDAGDTELDLVRPYVDYFPRNLVDASKGDQAYLLQYTVHDAGYHDVPSVGPRWDFYKSIASASGPFPFTVANDQLTELSSALSPAQQQLLPLVWQVDENTPGSFSSYRAALNPNAAPDSHFIYLNVSQADQGRYGWAVSMVRGILPAMYHQADRSMALEYGDPFPAAWVRSGYAESLYTVNLPMGYPVYGTISVADLLQTFPTMPLRPQVSPVQGATVAGVSLFSDQMLATATPLIQWNPPAVGTATSYAVQINELHFPSWDLVANLQTTGTQLVVPPGIFRSGQRYYVMITALLEPGHSLETAPLMYPYPMHTADAVGGMLTMP